MLGKHSTNQVDTDLAKMSRQLLNSSGPEKSSHFSLVPSSNSFKSIIDLFCIHFYCRGTTGSNLGEKGVYFRLQLQVKVSHCGEVKAETSNN